MTRSKTNRYSNSPMCPNPDDTWTLLPFRIAYDESNLPSTVMVSRPGVQFSPVRRSGGGGIRTPRLDSNSWKFLSLTVLNLGFGFKSGFSVYAILIRPQ